MIGARTRLPHKLRPSSNRGLRNRASEWGRRSGRCASRSPDSSAVRAHLNSRGYLARKKHSVVFDMRSKRSCNTRVVGLLLVLVLGQGSGVVSAATIGVDDVVSPRAPTSPPAVGTGATDVKEVFQLNSEIKAKQQRLVELRARIDRYRQSISAAQSKAKTLQGQLAVVEDRIAKKVL